jgi:hypothetical protein
MVCLRFSSIQVGCRWSDIAVLARTRKVISAFEQVCNCCIWICPKLTGAFIVPFVPKVSVIGGSVSKLFGKELFSTLFSPGVQEGGLTHVQYGSAQPQEEVEFGKKQRGIFFVVRSSGARMVAYRSHRKSGWCVFTLFATYAPPHRLACIFALSLKPGARHFGLFRHDGV